MWINGVSCLIHKENLRHNVQLLQKTGVSLLPVIKADAYGHGRTVAAQVLAEQGIDFMAVGTVGEGLTLRQALDQVVSHVPQAPQVRLLALMGLVGHDDAHVANQHHIVPLIHDAASLQQAAAHSGNEPLPVAVKLDTGMSRLGFEPENASQLAEALRVETRVRPVLLVSHLAAADDPGDPTHRAFTRQQAERFFTAARLLQHVFPQLKTSLGNTAGLLICPELAGDYARPGLALYGYNPLYNTPEEAKGAGLLPVMEACAPVLAVHSLEAGCKVGYGCTFTAQHSMRVAVVGAGYADGYFRALSGKGQVNIDGHRASLVGLVCMQMSLVDVSHMPQVRPGDTAWLLGGPGPQPVSAQELAQWCDTIPYEILCALGTNR